MAKHKRRRAGDVRNYILANVEHHPLDIAHVAASMFRLSREAVARQLRQLVKRGLLKKSGKTKGTRYEAVWLTDKISEYQITANLSEDSVWRADIRPLLEGSPTNVIEICQYGFTEIFNNAIAHSESELVKVCIQHNPALIALQVYDPGVGIFNKIQRAFNLDDRRHALLELSKGKLTTDPDGHTGEGIFFTSRMFDEFTILSSGLFYRNIPERGDWLVETKSRAGTFVYMRIRSNSKRKSKDIFDRYSSGKGTFDFSRTHVPLTLARYGDEQLVSRSQAKRVLARFERFKEVVLDFKDINTIGHSFADEIFRVYRLEHPDILVRWARANARVSKVIARAMSDEVSPETLRV